MLFGLGPLVYQERRRLIFVVAMAFLAGFLFYLRSDLYVLGVHVSLVTGAVYAVVVGLSALFICLCLPSLRFMIEAVAIARLGVSIFVLFAPGIGHRLLTDPFVMAIVVVLGGAAISRLLHGRIMKDKAECWRDRLIPRQMFQRTPARLRATPWQLRFVGWMDDAIPVRA